MFKLLIFHEVCKVAKADAGITTPMSDGNRITVQVPHCSSVTHRDELIAFSSFLQSLTLL